MEHPKKPLSWADECQEEFMKEDLPANSFQLDNQDWSPESGDKKCDANASYFVKQNKKPEIKKKGYSKTHSQLGKKMNNSERKEVSQSYPQVTSTKPSQFMNKLNRTGCKEVELSPNSYMSTEQVKRSDLHVIDTDSAEEASVSNSKRKYLPRKYLPRKYLPRKYLPRLTKSSSLPEKSLDMEVNKTNTSFLNRNINSPEANVSSKEIIDSSRPNESFSYEADYKENSYIASKPTNTYEDITPKGEPNRPIISPKNRDTNPSELSADLKSALTFGDTQGLRDQLQSKDYLPKSQTAIQNYQLFGPSEYQTTEEFSSVHMSDPKSPAASEFDADSSDTDAILRKFIRQVPPPSSSATNISNLNVGQSAEKNSQPAVMHSDGHDSGSSWSNSPLQINSPYGLLETQNLPGSLNVHVQNSQLPFLMSVQGNREMTDNVQTQQLPNTYALQIPYAGFPPGYVGSNVSSLGLPVSHPIPIISQYRFNNPNIMVPSVLNQEMVNQTSQFNQVQQYQLAMMSMQQYYENQLATKQMQNMNPPRMLPAENHSQTLNNNYPQMLHQTHMQIQNQIKYGMLQSTKSREELMLEFNKNLQLIHVLEKQLQQLGVPVPYPLSLNFRPYPRAPVPVGIANYYPGIPVLSQIQHSPNEQMLGTAQLSSTSQQGISGLFMAQDINTVQTLTEPKIGRGRGRIQ